jgi:hypothetical protein
LAVGKALSGSLRTASVLKFLFLNGLRSKPPHRERFSVLGEQACSLSQQKRWIRRFEDSGFSCEDDDRSGRPFSDLSDIIQSGFSCPFCTRIIEGKLEFQAQSSQKELIVYMDNSMYHRRRKIQEYFAKKKMVRTPNQIILQICHRVTLVLRVCQGTTERPTDHS